MIDYSYDQLSRLIEADYNNGATIYNYGYDVAGNLVNYDGVSRTYNAANQMTHDGTNTLTYDNNGNLRTVGSDTYTWDRANRLLSVGNHSYVYDGLGNRVQQTVSSVVTDYLNDLQPGLTKLLKQDDGTSVERFVHAPRGIHAVDDGTDWNFYVQDGLGSVRAIVDMNAVIQSNMNYDPYGNPMGPYGAGFGFTGEQTDENDNIYLRARYMNPNMGTFLSLDPFEGIQNRPMSLNGYSWVEGNVLNAVDPSGKVCTLPDRECSFIRMYADEWLEAAQRLNIFSFTNLSNEAFAIMIGAKAIFEDGTFAVWSVDFWDQFESDTSSILGQATTYRTGMSVIDSEISFGPANIPLRQAHYLANWCTSTPEFEIGSFQTQYWDADGSVAFSDWWFGLGNAELDNLVARELNTLNNRNISRLADVAEWEYENAGGFYGYTSSWYEWLSVAIDEAAHRALHFRDNNDVSNWGNPRNEGDPVSAYIIALGVDAYNESDEILYDLARWEGKGGHFTWVQAMQSIKDNLQAEIPWMQTAQWLPWTDQENVRLNELPL